MRYDAFISYSHAADDRLAPAVQRGLQTLARPWNRRRALEVFRDDTGLAVSPGLWTSICAGLDESTYFVLLASPEAAASTWVNQEIERWSASHSVECLLPVVTAGEWVWRKDAADFDWARSTAVPSALRGLFGEEPRHLDMRWARSEADIDLRNSRFKEAIAQIAAPMHGMSPEDLESADVEHYRRVVRLRRAVVAALAVLLVLVSAAGVLALKNAETARRQTAAAEASRAEAELEADRRLAGQLRTEAELQDRRNKAVSMLLRIAAARLDPEASWGPLVTSVGADPGLAKVYDLPPAGRTARWRALSPTGELFTWVNPHGALELWDLRNSQSPRRPLTCAAPKASPCPGDASVAVFGLSVSQPVFGADDTLAAVYAKGAAGVGDGGIIVWDTDSGAGRLLPQSSEFANPAFDADGRRLAAVNEDGTVRLWDVKTSAAIDTMPLPKGGRPTDVAFSLDGTALFEGTQDPARIASWDLTGHGSSAPERIALAGGDYPVELVPGPHGGVASLDSSGAVRLWDGLPRSPGSIVVGKGQQGVVDIAFSPDAMLATAGRNGLLRLWDPRRPTRTGPTSRAGDAGSPIELTFAPSGSQLISVSTDVRVWETSQWATAGTTLYRHPGAVTSMAVSPTGLLASADDHGAIWLSGPEPGTQPRALQKRGPTVQALAVSANGVLAAGSADGFVDLWDVATGQRLDRRLDGQGDPVVSLAFGPDSHTLAVAYRKPAGTSRWPRQPIRVWDVNEGVVQDPLIAGLAADVRDLDFSPRAELAAAGRDYGGVWTPPPRESQGLPADGKRSYFAVSFSTDGRVLAATSTEVGSDGRYRVSTWHVPDELALPEALVDRLLPGSAPHAIEFGQGDRLLAGAGPGGVQMWDAVSLEAIGGPFGSAATSAAFSTDDRTLIVGQLDGRVQAYPASIEGWLERACALVGRNLTESEWNAFVGDEVPYAPTCPRYE